MKKFVILLFSLSLLVLIAPVTSQNSFNQNETTPIADHPIQPPV
jgi:hypothetical protein